VSLTREVRALALPAIAHSLLQTLVFVVDRAMLGHHDSSSLAGMQIAGPVEWSVWSIFLAFEVGTIAAIGRFVGQNDRAAARTTLVVSLAYATIAQVGLMFVECGLGFHRIALMHLSAHALLRYYQFLQTPSVLQYALARRAALGATIADESAARWEVLGVRLRRYLYRLAIERFEVEATLERWAARPMLQLSARLDRAERLLFRIDKEDDR